MFPAFVIIWLLFGLVAAWRHLTVVADRHQVGMADAWLAALLLFAGPLGLVVHRVLFGRP